MTYTREGQAVTSTKGMSPLVTTVKGSKKRKNAAAADPTLDWDGIARLQEPLVMGAIGVSSARPDITSAAPPPLPEPDRGLNLLGLAIGAGVGVVLGRFAGLRPTGVAAVAAAGGVAGGVFL